MIADPTWLSAAEAARVLGVTPATLYAYVSRGLVRSESSPAERRKRYRREDIEALKQRRLERAQPHQALAQALHFGSPLCESALTLISDGRLYYRGLDACQLARSQSLEEVASLLWLGDLQAPLDEPEAPFQMRRGAALPPLHPPQLAWKAHEGNVVPALLASCVELGPCDPGGFDLRPACVQRTGMRILRSLTRALSGHWGPCAPALAEGWACQHPQLLSMALVLCADHELNVSAFTARCVASSGASPWSVVTAALAALEGHRHGGMTLRVEALLQEARLLGARRALAERLRRGEGAPGFGHQLYPAGDPRGRLLLDSLPPGPRQQEVFQLEACARELVGEHPTVDYGLVGLAHCLGLPTGSALALFALGRTVGWIAHALEQYASGQLIRPRARYVGPLPG